MSSNEPKKRPPEPEEGVGRKRRPGPSDEDEDEYFKSYNSLDVHEAMLRDYERTSTYRKAITGNPELFRGKTVLDVGAGTGILSCFCVQAGAAKVFAIEASAVASELRNVVSANGMSDKIVIVPERVEDCVLPEKVDIIVSEWMGYMLLYESMLNSVIVARDRWLKPNGLMFPSVATIHFAPITNDAFWENRVEIWSRMMGTYGVDMSCLLPTVSQTTLATVQIVPLCAENVLARAQCVFSLNLKKITEADLAELSGRCEFSCYGMATMHGIGAWFTVGFPGEEQVVLSTAPYLTPTHWEQCALYLDEPCQVEQDTKVACHLTMRPNAKNHRFLDVLLSAEIGEHTCVNKSFSLTDTSHPA